MAKKSVSPKQETKAVDTRLSYSSGTMLKNCERKYYYYKGLNLPKDPDADQDETAFNVGKCFHYVMETNGHTETNLEKLLDEGCKTFGVEEYKAMIHAMLLRYLQVHKLSGLKAIKCELAMSNNEFLGYIDIILQDEKGFWWLADLKTTGRYSEITTAKLHNDVQLNLYTYFYDKIAGALDLDVNKFMGCRYRVTTKSDLTQKANESYSEFVLRTAKNVKSYDIIVPLGRMNPKEIYEEHMRLQKKSILIRSGEVVPSQNFTQCDSYFRPCEYFSQCHGSTFTELKDSVEMLKSNNA